MGGLRVSNEVILAKTEVTYGTDPTPAAGTNAVLVRNPNMTTEGLRMVERGAIRASLGQLQRTYGGELRKLTFECEIKGSGAAGTAPEIGPLLTACGMSETVVAVTSVTYKPTSVEANHKSITLYYYEGGRKLHILTGCRGTVSFSLEAGGLCIASFEFTGHYTQTTDASQPTTTYSSQVPKCGLNMAVSLNGVTAIVARSWQWALNNVIEISPSLAAADGYGPVIIASRDVTGSMVIESELASVINIDALLAAGTRFAFASGTLGSTAGNRVAFSTPASSTYVTNSELQDGNGLRLRNIPLAVDDSTADSELSIAFT